MLSKFSDPQRERMKGKETEKKVKNETIKRKARRTEQRKGVTRKRNRRK